MYRYSQRLIATLLLCSGLLQSCHSPYVGSMAQEIASQRPTAAKHKRRPKACANRIRMPRSSLRLDKQGLVGRNSFSSTLSCRCEPSERPKICTGTSSFAEIVLESDVFVDKSLFIQEFLESGDTVSVITRPRRWGKSLNMDMLKCFLSIEVDDQGKSLSEPQSVRCKLFAGGEVVVGAITGKVKRLSPLKIMQQYPDLVRDYQGQYPVISLSLQNVDGSSYQRIEARITRQILSLYGEHYSCLRRYIQPEEKLLEDAEKEQLNRYFAGELDQEDLRSSLRFLSKVLYKHFGKPVYILIDEYDTPINSISMAYLEHKRRNEPEEQLASLRADFVSVSKLLREWFESGLKENPYLKQGMLTGILKLAKANLFSSLNNVREYTLLDSRFATSYGFTQQELDELLIQVPISTSPEEIQRWYKGYTFGDRQISYNPWSIMCYLSEDVLDPYWLESGSTQLIDPLLTTDRIQSDLQTLVSGGAIESCITDRINFDDITESAGLYSLLLFSGYLTPVADDGKPNPETYWLSIPNYEVKRFYEQQLSAWVSQKLGIDPAHYEDLADLLVLGQVEKFVKDLQSFLQATTSLHQMGHEWVKTFYRGFM
ncbi:MAG: AAA family ATPase [Bacteroidota bacterium]